MKFDLHCHTKEGSIDGKIPVEEYIRRLKELGYGGMLITDHDSYNGYRHWKKHIKGKKFKDFVVLKGIEYDTIDGGHILVIMPENIKLRFLEFRGLPTQLLIRIVHRYGGILGPAHPYGERHMSFASTQEGKKLGKARSLRKMKLLMEQFDFVEIYNACETDERNAKAQALAEQYQKPGIGGSDSHKPDCIGTAYTLLPDTIKKESNLIAYIKTNPEMVCGGTGYEHTVKGMLGILIGIYAKLFYWYNILGAVFRRRKRNMHVKQEIHEAIVKQ